MRRRFARSVAVAAAVLAAAGAGVVSAAPAQACSCKRPDVDQALAAGATLAIVTRTDSTPNRAADGSAPVATFRLEAFAGPEPPAELRGEMDTGASCQPYVAPGALAALIFRRDGAGVTGQVDAGAAGGGLETDTGRWHLGSCAEPELGPALQRVLGRPTAVAGGQVVAYAAGHFGGARVVALDERGRTVAWDGRGGSGERVAVCPGGRTVVSVGRTDHPDHAERVLDLAVHDPDDLRVRRTVTLPASHRPIVALRCHDGQGRRVDLVERTLNDDTGRLVSVDGTTVTLRGLGDVKAAVAVADGFLAAVSDRSTSVVRIRGDRTTTIVELADHAMDGGDREFAVSPDGRTVALFGYRRNDGLNPVLTFDTRTGRKLGEWGTKTLYVTGLGWISPDRLLLRHEVDYRATPVPVLVFDRRLERKGAWRAVPDEWGGAMTTIGDAAVLHGSGSRLTVLRESGVPLVADSLRLPAAAHVVGVPGRTFATAGPAPEPTGSPEPGEVTVADDRDPGGAVDTRVVVGALGGTAGAALIGGAIGLARRRRA